MHSWNDRITESRNHGRTWQIQYSPTFQSGAIIFFNDAEPFKQITNTLSTEGSMWNLVKIAHAVSEKQLKITQFYTWADNHQGTKFWL